MQTFFDAYVECALWSSTDDQDRPMDGQRYELAPEALTAMQKDCEAFLASNHELIDSSDYTYEQAGHDFWLTRNHHGCGFWECDHCDEATGDKLTKAAHAFGSSDLYIGDDGRIYVS